MSRGDGFIRNILLETFPSTPVLRKSDNNPRVIATVRSIKLKTHGLTWENGSFCGQRLEHQRYLGIATSRTRSYERAPEDISIQDNEIADALAKAGADDASVPFAPLTYLELFSRAKSRIKTTWLIPPEQRWYQGSRPDGCLSIDCSRRDQTTLTRFLSGHIRSLTFSDNSKCFEICPQCTAEQATPDHILACLGLSKQDLVSDPLLNLDFFGVHRFMDLI
ncbi:hypothetical protein AVEN_209746-1 [Araneus ventricosus]|uniref:Uncharacterized protein n=1 Tax=Araneus ventricosus TaxID=182803 RepID=A0A4Y2CFE5_ARAVE|nr:hypothetical protein AVEN_209746-1 [Araneus ventricosus]